MGTLAEAASKASAYLSIRASPDSRPPRLTITPTECPAGRDLHCPAGPNFFRQTIPFLRRPFSYNSAKNQVSYCRRRVPDRHGIERDRYEPLKSVPLPLNYCPPESTGCGRAEGASVPEELNNIPKTIEQIMSANAAEMRRRRLLFACL